MDDWTLMSEQGERKIISLPLWWLLTFCQVWMCLPLRCEVSSVGVPRWEEWKLVWIDYCPGSVWPQFTCCCPWPAGSLPDRKLNHQVFLRTLTSQHFCLRNSSLPFLLSSQLNKSCLVDFVVKKIKNSKYAKVFIRLTQNTTHTAFIVHTAMLIYFVLLVQHSPLPLKLSF